MGYVDVFDLKSGQDVEVEPIKVSVKFARKMDVCNFFVLRSERRKVRRIVLRDTKMCFFLHLVSVLKIYFK